MGKGKVCVLRMDAIPPFEPPYQVVLVHPQGLIFGHRQAVLALRTAHITPGPENPAAKIDALHRFLNAASSPFIRLCTTQKRPKWVSLCWYTLRGSNPGHPD